MRGQTVRLGPWRRVTVYCPDRTASAALIAATLLHLRPRVWHQNYAKTRQLLKPDATCEVRLHLNSPLLYCSGGSSSMKTAEIGTDGDTYFNDPTHDPTSCRCFPRGHRQSTFPYARSLSGPLRSVLYLADDLCGLFFIHPADPSRKSELSQSQRDGWTEIKEQSFRGREITPPLIASTMRFSTLVLLVALPVVACAILSPQQLSVRQIENCVELGHLCFPPLTVCCGEENHCPLTHEPGTVLSVCSSVSSLPLTNWYVRCAPPNPVLESGSLG